MNIKSTNMFGLNVIKSGLLLRADRKINIPKKEHDLPKSENEIFVPIPISVKHIKPKVFRVTKKIMQEASKIEFKSIEENLNYLDTGFQRAFILLDNDKSGVIEIIMLGSDILFCHVSTSEKTVITYSNYSMLTSNFSARISKTQEPTEDDCFPIKLLIYMFYGEISNKIVKPKQSKKLNSFTKFLNNSDVDINYVDSLWKTRVTLKGEFFVRGHFRFQPYGENRKFRKIIWVDEFVKNGYNRKSGLENYNNN